MTDTERATIKNARDLLKKSISTDWMCYAADALQILELLLREKALAVPPETAS